MKIGPLDNSKPVAPAVGGHDGRDGATLGGKLPPAQRRPKPAPRSRCRRPQRSLVSEANADFDAEKVERIAQAIRDGKFKVNAEAIADKLIANAQELLGGPQH